MDNKTFLGSVAERYAARDNGNILFVFPNRRSSLFFGRAMERAGAAQKPACITIDRLIETIAGLKPVGRIEALATLHRCWQAVAPQDERLSFDAFLAWGDTLLSDLEDAERSCVDFSALPDNLEAYLQDRANPLLQSIDSAAEGGVRENLLRLWPILAPVQKMFRDTLAEGGSATAGMMQRRAAEEAAQRSSFVPLCSKDLVFVGLGSLSACEKRVLDRLRDEGHAEFLWDFDGEAVTAPGSRHAALIGDTVRRYPSREPLPVVVAGLRNQDWNVVHVPSATGQARVAGGVIAELLAADPEAAEETAVVLADGALLLPTLAAVPEEVDKINVTMGYPLASGAASTLTDLLETLQKRAKDEDGRTTFHHEAVLALLASPYVRAACGEAAAAAAAAVRQARAAYVPQAALAGNDALRAIFRKVEARELPAYLKGVYEALQATAQPLEREFLHLYHKLVCETEAALGDDAVPGAAAWFRLLRRAAAGVNIPFEGEPLQGLQIMGPLETRCLDMKYVIFLGAAEGKLPETGTTPSLLPPALRRSLGMTVAEDREAVATYHFWRSTCRAERIWLVHDCRTGGMASGEESRFIKQLRYLYGVTPKETVADDDIAAEALRAPDLTVSKTEDVMRILEEKFFGPDGRFSATSINAYLTCRLRYWWEHVLGVKEDEGIVEDPDAAVFGTVFHDVMERLYKDKKERTLVAADIRAMRDHDALARLTDEAFAAAGVTLDGGRGTILREVICRLVDRTLETDEGFAPLVIHGTERPLGLSLTLDDGRQVRLFGKIDRLDTVAGSKAVRVVDYKSGSVKGHTDTRDVDKIFDRSLGARRPHVALQLYLYEILAKAGLGDKVPYEPCVYSTRGIFDGAPVSASPDEEACAAFEKRLKETIEEIFDPAVPFTAQDDDPALCEWCPFHGICNRG